MKKARFSVRLLLFVLSFTAFGTFYTEAQEAAQVLISDISIIGLKRTRLSVPERLLEGFLGTPASELDRNKVSAILLETGIFEDIQVQVLPAEDNTALLQVELVEKWSILPLPIFAAGSEGITAGAALMDMNALGLNDKLFVVALKLPGGWMATTAYAHPAPSKTAIGWNLSAFFSRRENTISDARDETIRRYEADDVSASAGLSLPVLPFADTSIAMAYRSSSIRDSDSILRSPDSSSALLFNGEISRSSSSWDGVFLSQRSASLQYTYNLGLDSPDWHTTRLSLRWEQAFFPGFMVNSSVSCLYEPSAPPVFYNGADSASIQIMPSSFTAHTLAGATLGMQARLVSLPFGSLALLLSYQGLYSEPDLSDSRIDHGPSGGLRLYIARVAVPAMDFGVAWNAVSGLYRINFGIGMQM